MSFPLSSGCFLFIFAECPESSKMKTGKKENWRRMFITGRDTGHALANFNNSVNVILCFHNKISWVTNLVTQFYGSRAE